MTLTTEDGINWRVDNLTNESGIYVLRLPVDSGVTTDLGPALTEDFVVGWTLRPGDANVDGLVNQLDIVQVQQCGRYLSGLPTNWTCGDWDGNGLFDQLDIVMLLQTYDV